MKQTQGGQAKSTLE